MIKLENYEVVGWEHAIRGMRNPKNSWGRMDSTFKESTVTTALEDGRCIAQNVYFDALAIGKNDHELMTTLAKGGPVHAKYRRMITVYVDITAPLYWWKEFDTYKVGTVANSCSTMHKIHEKEFVVADFSCEHLLGCEVDGWNHPGQSPYGLLWDIVKKLNECREMYLKTKDKKYWWQMIQLLPSSYNQKRTVMLNYEVLANMYKSRKAHKLDEWRELCKWIEQLPYAELIVGPSLTDIPICKEIMAEAERRVREEEPKTEIAYLCDGEQCDPCNNIDCNHTLDINHAVNFEKVGDYKYMEKAGGSGDE